MKNVFLLSLLLFAILSSCTGVGKSRDAASGDTIQFKYARLLTVVRVADDSVVVSVRNPWDSTATLRTVGVHVPVRRAVVYTSPHVSLLVELGVMDRIAGVCDANYITNDSVKARIDSGRIIDLGMGSEPSLEGIIDLQPDILMPSPYQGQNGYGRLEQMHLPILDCADYMEVSPLARAEWIRLYGILFGCEHKADSIFDSVCRNYNTLKAKVAKTKTRPTLITERPFNGQWYMPSGGSTSGILYKDAGARYLFADIPGTASQPVSIEQAIERGLKADYWLIKSFGSLTRAQINSDSPQLKAIKAKLYITDTTKSCFFDETPFHPDILLENLINIFHPEIKVTVKKQYFLQE